MFVDVFGVVSYVVFEQRSFKFYFWQQVNATVKGKAKERKENWASVQIFGHKTRFIYVESAYVHKNGPSEAERARTFLDMYKKHWKEITEHNEEQINVIVDLSCKCMNENWVTYVIHVS